jgi:hypothetical protein
VAFSYSKNLIAEITAYYAEVYGTELSNAQAEEFLGSLSGLYDVMQRSAQVMGGEAAAAGGASPNPRLDIPS